VHIHASELRACDPTLSFNSEATVTAVQMKNAHKTYSHLVWCVTGHTLSGLDNVEVGRQQLYTANLTYTYRGGSSVPSRVCPQGC
jgi:hypothetical protein